jgi:hypothetical protein
LKKNKEEMTTDALREREREREKRSRVIKSIVSSGEGWGEEVMASYKLEDEGVKIR